MNHDEDPLDLLEDDEDGVIETILLLDDEEEEKDIQARTGCSVVLLGIGLAAGGAAFGLVRLLA